MDGQDAGNAVVFRVAAKIVDQANAGSFLEPAHEAVAAGKPLVLDLSEVRFLNSSGLGAIVALVRDAELAGSGVVLCAPQPTVRALFAMVKLENIVAIVADVEAALATLAGRPGPRA